MKRAFGDTHYFLALLNPRDQDHARAVELSRAWKGEIVTTRWILTEIADGLALPSFRAVAAAFIRRAEASPFVRILPDAEEQFSLGFDLYAARPDKEWSLTDCISFVVMRNEGLSEALTADHHFEQAGFVALLR